MRHDAAAPPVDVYVERRRGDHRPHQSCAGAARIPADAYTVKVTAAGSPSVVVVPDTPLTLKAKTNTIVYAVGDLAGGSFTVIVQVLPLR